MYVMGKPYTFRMLLWVSSSSVSSIDRQIHLHTNTSWHSIYPAVCWRKSFICNVNTPPHTIFLFPPPLLTLPSSAPLLLIIFTPWPPPYTTSVLLSLLPLFASSLHPIGYRFSYEYKEICRENNMRIFAPEMCFLQMDLFTDKRLLRWRS